MKNRGFSLIELIVVIAIMAVALTVGGYALSAISLANAKNCATEIKSSLEKTRMQACSTDNASIVTGAGSTGSSKAIMTLKKDSSGKVIIVNYDGSSKEIGGKAVTVRYGISMEMDEDDYLYLDTSGVTFGFNRSTGGFSDSTDVRIIQVSSGGRTYKLTCYALTGKIKME